MRNPHDVPLKMALRIHLMAVATFAALTTLTKRAQFETPAKYSFFALGLVLGSTTMISIILAVRAALRQVRAKNDGHVESGDD